MQNSLGCVPGSKITGWEGRNILSLNIYCQIAFQNSHIYLHSPQPSMGFSGSSAGKEPICNAGDPGLIPGLGSSPGEGIGYPLQYLPGESP